MAHLKVLFDEYEGHEAGEVFEGDHGLAVTNAALEVTDEPLTPVKDDAPAPTPEPEEAPTEAQDGK